MGAAVAALLVISVIWWPGTGLFAPGVNTSVTAMDQVDDEKFMAEIRVLIENYTIGYGLVYGEYGSSHHFTISLAP